MLQQVLNPSVHPLKLHLMSNRTIAYVSPAFALDMGGIQVYQSLPSQGHRHLDPVLLIHHLNETYAGGISAKGAGVGPHPHRGFAPVSFLYQGGIHHRDAMGNSSVVYAGGTQWMDSGSGTIHSERPPQDLLDEGFTLELVQVWFNTPAAHKMDAPRYQPLTAADTPQWCSGDGLVQVGVVAGEWQGIQGPIETTLEALALRLELKAGARVTLPLSAKYQAAIYQLNGKLLFQKGQYEAHARTLTAFAQDGDHVTFEAIADTQALLLGGEPTGEHIATYGPFVMNTAEELQEAIHDFQAGKMGELIE